MLTKMLADYPPNTYRDFLIIARSDKKTCSECRIYNPFKKRCPKINKYKSPYAVACRGFIKKGI